MADGTFEVKDGCVGVTLLGYYIDPDFPHEKWYSPVPVELIPTSVDYPPDAPDSELPQHPDGVIIAFDEQEDFSVVIRYRDLIAAVKYLGKKLGEKRT